jgi:hypothetical protein
MNNQPIVPKGFYIHYKNKLYRLLDFATEKNTLEEYVIYQPQYHSEEFGDDLLWIRPKEMFFEDINLEGKITPRFRYLAKTAANAEAELRQRAINITPMFKKSGLEEIKNEDTTSHIKVFGFARHSETLETYVIYSNKNEKNLLVLAEKKFYK